MFWSTCARRRRFRPEGMLCGRDVCSGQKRGRLVGKTKRGKGTKIMGLADRHGLPLALRTESASPAEVKLVEATLEARVVAAVPEQLIGDKAYDSDRLDEQLLQEYGTELIAPNRRRTAPNPRRSEPETLPPSLEDRTALRLAVQLPTVGRALRIPCGELPRFRSPWGHRHPLAAFMR